MADTITVSISGDPEILFDQAKKTAEQQGISLEGDHNEGTFSGLGAVGKYRLEGKTLYITIEKKPTFFPISMIETLVQKLFS